MDFHTLSRRELQTLCKKNKIPANITNVAMADALSALPQVEGLAEILNPREGGDVGTPAVQPRTACRTSTQRKPVKEPQTAANVPVTPAVVLSSRRRAPAVYTRRKKEVIVIEDDVDADTNEVQGKPVDVAKTPAVAPTSRSRAGGRSLRNKTEIPDGTSVQKAYSTRRSVRLLGSSLSKMSLVETEEDTKQTKIDDVSEEMSGVSQHEEASVGTEKAGTSLQPESTVVSRNTDEVEVSSINKADCESQSHVSGPEMKSTYAEDVLQAEPEEEISEEVNHVEAAQEHPGLNLQDSFETCIDLNDAEGSVSAIQADKDETSGDFGAENEKESHEVEKVIVQLSMLDVAVKKDPKDNEELEAGEDTESAVVAQINDQKTGDTVIESVAQLETKESANEIQAVPNIMKENLKTIDAHNMSMGDLKKMLKQKLEGKSNMADNGNDDVHNMSIRGLKKMLKQKLDGKSNMADNGDVQMQEVEKKRTALQALPQNVNCDAPMTEY
ncbi:hypothetical protein TSUD_60990 [Trifolium subterraneum]|uniref:Uncharacterized protein n=1 Tax=Trifolium subterraneum TaxID=3900 RepID=A0A2Z6NQW2_TRISU|nr:hypothetical protein TSUD_60990 [Trifolium subterraneum]